MNSAAPVLAVEGLWADYGDQPILRGVDLTVGHGEFVGLIGPNGSGKSTLLRVASGALSPSRGEVSLLTTGLASLSPVERARTIAIVVQSPTLPESFTALDLVLWGRTPYLGFLGQEGPHDFAIAREAMEATESWTYASRPVGDLSGGERQRVALAKALAQKTPLLLLDEPTAHLDIHHQTAIFDLVHRLLREGRLKGVLAAVHDLTLAARYCDSLILLNNGEVEAKGPPAAVLTAETVERVYRAPVVVVPHPLSGTPAVLPAGRTEAPDIQRNELARSQRRGK